MVEPDGVMNGPLWPADWNTGWVTWRYSDLVGQPLTGTIRLQLSVARAVSVATKTTVLGGTIEVPLENGVPSGAAAVQNGAGVWCVEVPISDDPDVIPSPIQLLATEVFNGRSGATIRKEVTSDNTLDDPLWLSGDLDSVASQPGVVPRLIYVVPVEASGPPLEAKVGDWVLYQDTGNLNEITEL